VRAGDTGRGDPLPAPDADDRRDRELVKARLFRSRGGPVQIGRFTVLARLGEGGMGVVYTAYDDQLGRKVAVKLLRGDGRHDLVARARLLREAQAMARLSHANIVAVHEVGATEDQQVFIAMEFVRGETLDAWLKGQVHGWREILGEFIAAGRGLAAAHRAGLIHRDFKPHNVIVGEDGIVKVLDFGLARASERAEDAADRVEAPAAKERLLDVALTHAGAVMGTPAYMAPEQHEGRPATARSDQFSFCVSLYEGLYGRHPFDCTSLGSLLSDVAAGRVRPPPPGTRVPPWLHRVVLRGLSGAHFGKTISVGARLLIGSDRGGLGLDDPDSSAQNAVLVVSSEAIHLKNLEPSGRTEVNGVSVHDAVLHPGDQLVFGRNRFILEAPGYPVRGQGMPTPANEAPAITQTLDAIQMADPVAPAPEDDGSGIWWLILAAGVIGLGIAGLLWFGNY